MLFLLVIVILIVVVFHICKGREPEKISVDVVREGLEEALFQNNDVDYAIDYTKFCKETYTEPQYVVEIEKVIRKYNDYLNKKFEKRTSMNRQELVKLRMGYFLLIEVDEQNKDIYHNKFDAISKLL